MASGGEGDSKNNQLKPSSSITRLPSLKGPRDLTLGGISKRKFAPTIPAPKIKKEVQAVEPVVAPSVVEKEKKPSNRGHGFEGRGRGRGRGRGQEVTQMKSIFEECPMTQMKQRQANVSYRDSSYSGGGRGGRGGGGSSRSSESFTTRTRVKIEGEEGEDDKEMLEELLRDDFIDDGFMNDDKNVPPVLLPLVTPDVKAESKHDMKILKEISDELPHIEIKKEKDLDMDIENIGSLVEEIMKESTGEPRTMCDLFNDLASDGGSEVFIQLPDCLPGYPPSKEISQDKKAQTKTAEIKPTETDVQDDCLLRDFTEGFIGKLKIRRSNRMTFVLGNIVLDGIPGMPAGFLQEVVRTKHDGSTGDMIVLNHVEHKFSFVPNINNMLDSISSRQS